jgi:membrane associated rhomboid family serine protease
MELKEASEQHTPSGSPPDPDRERLLIALLDEDPGLMLTQHDEASSLLFAPAGPRRFLLLSAAGEQGAVRAQGLVERLVENMKKAGVGEPETHVVAVGGGDDIGKMLRKAAPVVQPAPMGFHHLGEEGGLTHVTGKELPLLERAAEKAASRGPSAPGRIAEALARGEELSRQAANVAARLSGSNRVTLALSAACVVMTGIAFTAGERMYDAALWRMGANNVTAVLNGEVWRLLAAAFLHGDLIHLALNMFALWSFGPMLEAMLGPRRYLLLYGASALGGSLLSLLAGPQVWSVGASGAIWGLMAAGIAVVMRPRGLLPAFLVTQMRGRVWLPLVINAAYSLRPGIDWRGHLGGGLIGFILVATVLTWGLKPMEQRSEGDDAELTPSPRLRAAAWGMAAAMALSVLTGLALGRPWVLSQPPSLARTSVPGTGLTMEVPELLASRMATEDREGIHVVTFGELPSLPMGFEVMAFPLESVPSAEELDALLESEGKALDQQKLEGAVRWGPAKRVMLGGRPAVMIQDSAETFDRALYLMVVGQKEVIVSGYAVKNRPEAWAGLEERVVGSLQLE